MKIITCINIRYKDCNFTAWKEYFIKSTKKELEDFEKEVCKWNPYISKVFSLIEESKKVIKKETKKETNKS